MIWRDRSIIFWKIACGIVQPSLFRPDAPPFDDLRVRRARTLNARPAGDRREDVPASRPSRQPISSRHNRCLLRRYRCGRRMSARQTARSPRPAGSWIGMYPPARRPAAGHRLDRRRRQCVESAHCSPARQAQTIDPFSARQRGNVDCCYVSLARIVQHNALYVVRKNGGGCSRYLRGKPALPSRARSRATVSFKRSGAAEPKERRSPPQWQPASSSRVPTVS
jgi:hypothetical protein